MQTDCAGEGALSITDYSPEWAYPEGGVKVLVAGPWTDTSDQYTVLFDNFPVPSILVQNGLLRCYCPGMYFFFFSILLLALKVISLLYLVYLAEFQVGLNPLTDDFLYLSFHNLDFLHICFYNSSS